MQGIIFSDEGAISFDPVPSLLFIDKFMTDNINNWVAPWADFSKYAEYLRDKDN